MAAMWEWARRAAMSLAWAAAIVLAGSCARRAVEGPDFRRKSVV